MTLPGQWDWEVTLRYLCHLTFDFWASLCYPLGEFFAIWLLPFVLLWSVISGWLGSGLVWLLWVWACRLIWVCRYLVQTAQAKMWSASSKVYPIWEHFGKNFMTGQPIVVIHWQRKVASKYHIFVATRWENGPTSQEEQSMLGTSLPLLVIRDNLSKYCLNFGYDTMTTGEKTQYGHDIKTLEKIS